MAGKAKKAKPKTTTEEQPPAENPLAPYLQIAREGDEHLVWVAELAEGGHTTTLYEQSREELEQRARTILSGRGIQV